MNDNASPRPWTFCQTYGEHRPNSIIVDADGGNVALVCHFANEEEENRIGNLIVDAVNGYEDANYEIHRLIVEKDELFDEAVEIRKQRDELRDLCVLLFDAVKHGNQVVDLPGIWNKAKEVLNRTDPEDKP